MLLGELKSFIKTHRDKGRSGAFYFDDETLDAYIKWAFMHDYLFVSCDNGELSAVGIAYPVDYKTNGEDFMFSFRNPVPAESESKYDICIMDVVSITQTSTKKLVEKFKQRFPHWENCDKWALRFGMKKLISNKYINNL